MAPTSSLARYGRTDHVRPPVGLYRDTFKKPSTSASPAVAQQLKAKDDEIEKLKAMLAAAGIKEEALPK